MCHPLNLEINGKTHADPSVSYSVVTRGTRAPVGASERFKCTALLVVCWLCSFL